jgi:hypothetical protein
LYSISLPPDGVSCELAAPLTSWRRHELKIGGTFRYADNAIYPF